jgi:hypothetical protein
MVPGLWTGMRSAMVKGCVWLNSQFKSNWKQTNLTRVYG